MTYPTVLAALHALAFAIYLGGLFFMEAVVEPAKADIPPAQAAVLSRRTGDRQMILAWSALAVILITGILRLENMGMLEFPGTFLLKPGLADSDYGQTLLALMGAWVVLVVAGLVMTFVLRPVLVRKIDPRLPKDEQQRATERMMVAARWMGIVMRVDLVAAAAAIVLGASLSSGGLL